MHHYQSEQTLLVTFASITSEVVAIELREIRLLDGRNSDPLDQHFISVFPDGSFCFRVFSSIFGVFVNDDMFCQPAGQQHFQVPEILANEASAWSLLLGKGDRGRPKVYV